MPIISSPGRRGRHAIASRRQLIGLVTPGVAADYVCPSSMPLPVPIQRNNYREILSHEHQNETTHNIGCIGFHRYRYPCPHHRDHPYLCASGEAILVRRNYPQSLRDLELSSSKGITARICRCWVWLSVGWTAENCWRTWMEN